MSDKSQSRSSAPFSSALNASQRQLGRFLAKAAVDEAFLDEPSKQGDISEKSVLTDEQFAIFGLATDPALRQG